MKPVGWFTFIADVYHPARTVTSIPVTTILPTTFRANKRPLPHPKRRAFKKIMKN